MNSKKFIISSAAISLICAYAGATTKETLTISQYGTPSETIDDWLVYPSDEKVLRLNSEAGYILADYSDGMPLEVKTCARVAIDLWENALPHDIPVRVRFEYAPIQNKYPSESELLCSADIQFVYDEETRQSIPTALYRQTHKCENEYDAVITINSNVKKWKYGHSIDSFVENDFDLTTALLRSLANTLGHCSGIAYNADGIPYLALKGITPYDSRIKIRNSDNNIETAYRPLSDFNLHQGVASQELADALEATSGNKRVMFETLGNSPEYLMSGEYLGENDFNCSDSEYSPMARHITNYTRMHNIGDRLVSKMKAIGWTYDSPEYKATNAIHDNGISSSSTITITGPEQKKLDNSLLCLNFRKKDGSMTDHEPTTNYPAVFDYFPLFNYPETYDDLEINVNGDCYGYLSGSFSIYETGYEQSRQYNARLRTSIPMPPKIENATFYGISEDGSHALILTTFRGSEQLIISTDASDGSHDSFVWNDKFVCFVKVPVEDNNADYTVGLTATNSKGIDTVKLTIPASAISGIGEIEDSDSGYNRMEVYDLSGRLAGNCLDNLPSGIYIVAYYHDSTLLERKKIVK